MVVWAPRRLARAAYWCREFCPLVSTKRSRAGAVVASDVAAIGRFFDGVMAAWVSPVPKQNLESKKLIGLA